MVRKKENPIEKWFWLALSVSGGVLFSFGLLNWFEELGYSSSVAVMVGGGVMLFAIVMGKFRTETSVAMKKR